MKIQLKRSNVLELGSAKEPTSAQMEFGELAVNYSNGDPAIFLKDSLNNIIRIAGVGNINTGDNPSGNVLPDTGNNVGDIFFNTGDNTLYYWDGSQWVPIANDTTAADIFVGTLAEINAEVPAADRRNGFLWWNAEDGTLYVWYIDENTSQWVVAVPASGSGGGASVSIIETAPTGAQQGDLWWNTTDGRLYVWYEDGDTTQWVDASPDSPATTYWDRAGTTLSPVNAGDDIESLGGATFAGYVSAAGANFATDFNGTADTFIVSASQNGTYQGQISYDTNANLTGYAVDFAGQTPVPVKWKLNRDGSTSFAGLMTLKTQNGRGEYSIQTLNDTATGYNVGQTATQGSFYILNKDNGLGVYLPTNASAWTPVSSEARLKTSIVSIDADQSWTTVRDISLYRYHYKSVEDKTGVPHAGPMAQELGALDPELLIDTGNTDDEGTIHTYNQGLLNMKALQALSTALTRIEALEATNTALEARLTALEGGAS